MLKLNFILYFFLIFSSNHSFTKSKEISGAEIQQLATEWLSKQGVKSNIKILPQIKYQACDNIVFTDISLSFKLIKVLCQKPSNWSFIIRNKYKKVDVRKKVKSNKNNNLRTIIVLKESLKKGQIVNLDDIKFIESNIKKSSGLITSEDSVVGKILKRSTSANRPIYESNLKKVWLVEKNSEIFIENNLGPITIKVEGIALENADLNEKIKVKNISSGQILSGYVENKKKVTLRAKQF